MKKRIFPRILSCVLATVMLFGMVPALNVSAAEAQVADVSADKQTAELKAEKPVAEVSASGVIDGIAYTISNGLATIIDYTGSATEVVIPAQIEGCPVKRIGFEAFKGCTKITSVTIPEGVSEIEEDAFSGCTKLASITIPSSVTGIYDSAFYKCEALASITIPEGATILGENVFAYCKSLTSLTIPTGTESIGYRMFYNCGSLESITLSEGVIDIGGEAFRLCRSLKSVTIPSSVTSIGENAFWFCDDLEGITIPEGVEFIGNGAFRSCYSLASITIPKGLISIGEKMFNDCRSLTSVIIPWNVASIGASAFNGCSSLTSVTIPPLVTSIGEYAFSNCTNLTSISIPEGVTSIGNSAFSGCTSLANITIPSTVTNIDSYAFNKCTSLTSITIPEGVTSIGNGAFSGCTSLVSITIPEGVKVIHSQLFSECTKLSSIVIPEGVKSISSYAFNKCYALKSITIPSSVTYIGAYATDYCYAITDVYYNGTQFQWNAITIEKNNSNLTDAIIHFTGTAPEGLEYKIVNGEVVITGYTGSATEITIPSTIEWCPVTSIGEGAFYGCKSPVSITIPTSVTNIELSAFDQCTGLTDVYYCGVAEQWSTITIGTNNEPLANAKIHFSEEIPDGLGYLITDDGVIITGYTGTATELTIPSLIEWIPVISISDDAFKSCSSLTSVTIPETVVSIGNRAFHSCVSLERITIPKGVTSIGEYIFLNCTGLTNITVDENNIVYDSRDNCNAIIETATNTLMYGCSNTVIPEGVTSIADYAFYGCKNITRVTIPGTVTSVGYMAFYNCTSLERLTILEGVASIGENAFSGCSSLTSIVLPSSLTSIGNYAFYSCTKLTNITIPEGVTSIGATAFAHCKSLTSIVLPSSLTSIGHNAFRYCTSITSVTIPGGVTSFGELVFDSCTSITSVTILEGVTSIGADAFSGCSSLTSIVLPSSLTSVATYAFYGCSALADVYYDGTEEQWNTIKIGTGNGYLKNATLHFKEVVPEGLVYEITDGKVTITGYTGSATELTIPETIEWCPVTSIGRVAFYNCTELTSITIPEGVESIGWNAFSNCTSLTNIIIPSSVTSIASLAFSDCTKLESVTISEGVKSIGEYAFLRCASLESITIPSGVTVIEDGTFSDCSKLASITIPSGLTNIGTDAFNNTAYYNNADNWQNDVLYIDYALIKAKTTLGGEYNVKDGTTVIAEYAFEQCTSLAGVTIPEGVSSIESGTFSKCSSLASVTIPESVTSIGNFAFSECTSFADVYYDGTQEQWNEITIGENNECLTNATIHFKETVPEGLVYEITDGKVTITGYTGSATELTIPGTIEWCPVTSIGDKAFFLCSSLESITIPNGVTSIGTSAFAGCSSLESITISASVISIGEYAFEKCTALSGIIIPEGVTTIAERAFYDCPNLENISVSSANTVYDSRDNCNAIIETATNTLVKGCNNTVIPEDVKSIGNIAFYGCTFESITIPEGVTSIGNSAFAACKALVSIVIPETVTNLGYGIFANCTSLESITIPEGITSIEEAVLYCCNSLVSVTIPESVTSIKVRAFDGCTSLTDVYYGGTEAQWNAITIEGSNTYLTNATVHFAKYSVEFLDFDGTVLGSQTVKAGEAATAPDAPQRKGYEFLGWDKEFSNVTGDITVTAKYRKIQTVGSLKVRVLGGTSFMISIDGGNARPQGSLYMNSNVPVGATVTVTAVETSGATFAGWLNSATGVVLSSNVDYTFVASGNDSINAVYNMKIEGVQVVAFKNDKSNRILDSQYYASTDAISFPDAPTQVGFEFTGWSMTEAEIQAAIANGEDVTVVATWTKALVPVEITVVGGEGSGTYYANNAVTVTANAAEEGKKFAYWTDASGNIRSYSEQYTFFPSADTTVTAVFVDENAEIDYQILVSLDSIDTTSVADKNVFTYSWYCPEEYTFVKAGIVAVNKDNYNESTFVAGSSDANVYDRSPSGANLKPVNTFTWTKSDVASGQTWMACAYVQYRDAEGQIITIYSDVVEAAKE